MDSESESADPQRVSHYRLLHSLGAGGMGEVFAAFDETLKRRVAIKAIHAQRLITDDAKARFLREAQILSRLDHPHICRVHDYLSEGGRDFLVLELIEGKSLRTAIQAGLERAAAMKIAQQVADVLVATHAAGIVHRDLKPGNIMLTGRGDAKVLDFGLARSINLDQREPRAAIAIPPSTNADETIAPADVDATRTMAGAGITGWSALPTGAGADFRSHTGSISGTIAYMSPEQAIGESPAAPSDMYSFGLILQEMLTGQPAFDKNLDREALLAAVRRGETRQPSGLEGEVANLITRLTAFAPTQRPTAVEVVDRLRWIAGKPARRIRRLAIASAIVAIVLAAGKYTIDLARERSAAVAAREDADRRRGQAESLIGFMLGNLRPKLQQVGRLDLLDDVGSEATKYFNTVPAGGMSGEELFRRSQALYQIGQVRQAEGKFPDAVAAYRESLAVAQQVAQRDPANAEWQLGVAMAHFYLGDALRLQGDQDGAMREFEGYRDVAKRLVERDPSNEQWQLELAYGHSNVASVLEAKGDLAGARRELELSQATKEALAALKPDDVERQQAVATGFNRLGVVLEKAGEPVRALESFLADLKIRRTLVAADPRNIPIRRNLVVALGFVGRAYDDRGDLRNAITHLEEAVEEASNYAAIDRRNVDWQRDLARGQGLLADCLRWQGDVSAAARLYQQSLAILRPLAASNRTAAARQRDLAGSELGAGWVALKRGSTGGAAAHAEAVQALLAAIVSRGGDREASRLAAEGRLLAADVAEKRGLQADALALRETALTLIPGITQAQAELRVIATRARALLAMDRLDEARPIVERLLGLSYRHPTLITLWTEKQRGARERP